MQNLRLSSVRNFHLFVQRGEGSARLVGGGGVWVILESQIGIYFELWATL